MYVRTFLCVYVCVSVDAHMYALMHTHKCIPTCHQHLDGKLPEWGMGTEAKVRKIYEKPVRIAPEAEPQIASSSGTPEHTHTHTHTHTHSLTLTLTH